MIPSDIIEVLDRFIEAEAIVKREKVLYLVILKMERQIGKVFVKQGRLFLEGFKKYSGLFEKNAEGQSLKEAKKDKGLTRRISQELNQGVDRAMEIIEIIISKEMIDTARHGMTAAMEKGFDSGVVNLGIDYSFNINHPRAVDYITRRGAELVTKVNETTRAEIKRIVTGGVENGLSYDQTAKQIRTRFREFAIGKPQLHIRSRAHLVAVTEAGNAYETGNFEAGKQLEEAGIKLEKYWATVGDNRVSDGCSANEGQGWIPHDEVFESGHEHPLRFPGCRCALLTRRKEGAVKQEKEISDLMASARKLGPNLQAKARKIAEKYKQNVTPINYKTYKSIKRKVNTEYGGNVSRIKDSVRTTIISDSKNIPKIIEDLKKDFIANHKIQNFNSGYSGHLLNVQTSKTGLIGEIQVNTPAMIYAKEKGAKQILSKAQFNAIKKKTGLPHGLGHQYYNELRDINITKERFGELEKLSKEYYAKFKFDL